jgi:hypothetical protein
MTEHAPGWLESLAPGMGTPDPTALATALAAAAAVLALMIVFYKEFLQGARLHATLDRISLLRMPPNARDQIIHEALIDDILSPSPSLRAQEIAGGSRETRAAVPTGDRKMISAALVERIRTCGHIDYFPPAELTDRYFEDRRFFNNFYTPVIVSNSGRKTAYISSLVLLARSRKSKSLWAFAALFTIDPLKILDSNAQTDFSRVSGQFVGTAVEPLGSIEIHPWFIPITDSPHRKLSTGSMPPGSYEMRITGYGSKKDRLLTTNWTQYVLTRELLRESFAGKDSIGNLLVDQHLADALTDI